jgi:small subunit ribosomal protein S6
MRNYEIAIIIHPELEDAAYNEVVERVQELIKNSDGTIVKVDQWGRKKLAYEINNLTEGQYVFFQTEMEPTVCSDIEHALQLNESIIRFMITSRV